MYVPDDVRKTVVFLGYDDSSGGRRLAGTGFFAARPILPQYNIFEPPRSVGFSYLITAKHVIDGIRSTGADKVWLRVNLQNRNAEWLESDIEDWIFHPSEPDRVDVAIRPCVLPEQLDHVPVNVPSFLTSDIARTLDVSAGEDLFLAGLFSTHHGTTRNIPIMRVGNIAAMPEEPVAVEGFGLIDAYLIEARSLGGISGSPVFVHMPAARAFGMMDQATRGRMTSTSVVYFLLGLMHGHWDTRLSSLGDSAVSDASGAPSVNMGIAIVVPASKILEVITQPLVREREIRTATS